jgi:Domain of unknown function (DUF4382)
MYKKIIGSLAVLLMIATAALPALAISTTQNQAAQISNTQEHKFSQVSTIGQFLIELKYLITHRFSRNSDQTENGLLVIELTSSDPQKVNDLTITISRIRVHHVNLDGEKLGTWMPVSTNRETLELVGLQDYQINIGERNIETGQYDKIDFTLVSAHAIINGKPRSLFLTTNEILLDSSFFVKQNLMEKLTVEFDIGASIHQLGNGVFFFNPVVKLL